VKQFKNYLRYVIELNEFLNLLMFLGTPFLIRKKVCVNMGWEKIRKNLCEQVWRYWNEFLISKIYV
jgi:hypothetical protein